MSLQANAIFRLCELLALPWPSAAQRGLRASEVVSVHLKPRT